MYVEEFLPHLATRARSHTEENFLSAPCHASYPNGRPPGGIESGEIRKERKNRWPRIELFAWE